MSTATSVARLAFIVWLTGLPGSGKTSIAKRLTSRLRKLGVSVFHLQMDKIRGLLVEKPLYTDEEREYAYRSLAVIALHLYLNGTTVIIDATAHKRRWRDFLRNRVNDYLEVYVQCPLGVCIARESKRTSNLIRRRLYTTALKRFRSGRPVKGLGRLPGLDAEYQESSHDKLLTLDSEKSRSAALAEKIVTELRQRQYLS